MRYYVTLFFLAASLALFAQIGVGGDAGTTLLEIDRVRLVTTRLPAVYPDSAPVAERVGSCAPSPSAPYANLPVNQSFDFSAAKPYLAFFCRLELDIEEATRFPVRFRLGEVRTWQQDLSKRE